LAFKRKNILFALNRPEANGAPRRKPSLASRLAIGKETHMSVTSEPAPASWIGARDQQPWLTEDWLSVGIGLLIFVLALVALTGTDLLGWAVTTSVWVDPGQALSTVSKSYAPLGGAGALIVTYLALLAVLSVAAAALKANVARFAVAFTVVFWIVPDCSRARVQAHFAVDNL
jgi:hypothetical protein